MRLQSVPFGRVVRVEATRSAGIAYCSRVQAGAQGILLPSNLLYVEGHRFYAVRDDDDVTVLDTVPPSINPANISSWQVGCDPEVFVFAGGKLLPAWEFLSAKQETTAAQTFWDGFQAEFTVAPSTCLAFVVDNIQAQLKAVWLAAKNAKQQAQIELSPACVVDVPNDLLETASDEHVSLGCSSSMNAYPSTEPLGVPDGHYVPIRTAGFHVHMGLGLMGQERAVPIVRSIDVLAGVLSVSLLAGLEDERRRSLYGRAGEYRLPLHGLEYRVFSSAVLAHPIITHIILDLTRASVKLGIMGQEVLAVEPAVAQDIINHLDVGAARQLVVENRQSLSALVDDLYMFHGLAQRGKVMHALEHGAASILPVDNMVKSWCLDTSWMVHSHSRNASVGEWG